MLIEFVGSGDVDSFIYSANVCISSGVLVKNVM